MKHCNPIRIIFIVLWLNTTVTTSDTNCKLVAKDSPHYKLKNYLFCNYDQSVRPSKKINNATQIEINIMPKFLEFSWKDPHLTWAPSDFSGINTLHVTSDEIWVPDIAVRNAGDFDEDQTGIPYTNCIVDYQYGDVLCVPPMAYKIHCNADYSMWPFDTLNCTVELAAWSYHTEEVILHNRQDNVIMSDFSTNQEWEVLKTKISHQFQEFKLDDAYDTSVLYLHFLLQRRSTIHLLRALPAFVLMVLTLCVLWLDPTSTERMVVACISFICHVLSMQDFMSFLPSMGSTIPNIFLFYEKSFMIMAFVIVLTVLLREMQDTTTTAPTWISSLASYALRSKTGQILLLSILDPQASYLIEKSADDNADLFTSDKRDSTWGYVSIIIGWVVFLSVFLAYVIMLAVFIPYGKVNVS